MIGLARKYYFLLPTGASFSKFYDVLIQDESYQGGWIVKQDEDEPMWKTLVTRWSPFYLVGIHDGAIVGVHGKNDLPARAAGCRDFVWSAGWQSHHEDGEGHWDDIYIPTDGLVPVSHWCTPEQKAVLSRREDVDDLEGLAQRIEHANAQAVGRTEDGESGLVPDYNAYN